MPNKKQLLHELKGQRVIIYSLEKEFMGTLREFDNEFSVSHVASHSYDIVAIKPSDIVDIKRLSTMPIIFVHNHFVF